LIQALVVSGAAQHGDQLFHFRNGIECMQHDA
jgi:hypothetical protein